MALFSLKDFYQNFEDQVKSWEGADVSSYDIYTDHIRQIGKVRDVLVDNSGHFRYLVAEICAWEQQKTVLIPIGLAQFDYDQGRAFIERFNATQLERLPSYHNSLAVDRGYEQRVRDAFRSLASCRAGRKFLQHPYTIDGQYHGTPSGYTYSANQDYNHNPIFYGMSDRDNQRPLKHLENHLIPQEQR